MFAPPSVAPPSVAPPSPEPSPSGPADAEPPRRLGQDDAGEGWETWRFLPETRLNRWYPAGLWTIVATARGTEGTTVTRHAEFWLKRETVFSAVEAERKGRAVRVSGVLNRVDPQGYLDYAPFADRPVEILHRAGAREDWTTVATTTTDRQGIFAEKVRGHRRGQWRARFSGTDHYAPALSAVHRAS
ncbi:hypothetical protein Plo01_34420 [Planobispora longispora]|uniref:Uncharacterized protein n=1 Tax=Planobispora longispora TaxID=28887 RepID=A0A8J3W603_9ACTN|nr:hypothetical protein Plo01_34420 [Planobispora longispora]